MIVLRFLRGATTFPGVTAASGALPCGPHPGQNFPPPWQQEALAVPWPGLSVKLEAPDSPPQLFPLASAFFAI